ncbi:MBL fold metallo-hydrolase [Corynebacterium yudongzhengii]|uniref:MBL fold metallo-hydrolase n=1 Tax=Corynebacterium yudongzhengii TaxID=2080740 RepID=A0A2U1T6X6_9CORY|nr:MBL fold metallo-hydrolase [Corynebacterium yudongzhengii]AWB82201.1 MBL fold metallo-hydrolase [Corynebacterium yudongzhengii]PWC01725.1 MBL fold metallo-hydrolase [Corynebacterium yudongzhengii]
MKITRRFHSCVEIREGNTTVIIDPGSFGAPENLADADAILITHIHPDHVDVDAVRAARAHNPALQIYGPAALGDNLELEHTTVAHGEKFAIGDIDVEVHESAHATIIRSIELPQNVGYVFNGRIFHPGDSFPDRPGMELVCVPISAPWMRMLNVDDYLAANRPESFIGVHDGIDNDNGRGVRTNLLRTLAKDHDTRYLELAPDESHELAAR